MNPTQQEQFTILNWRKRNEYEGIGYPECDGSAVQRTAIAPV